MSGRALAVSNGDGLAKAVVQLGRELGLEAMEQVKVARRIWGAERYIDVVLTHPQSRKTLGIECKFQAVRGTAEEKIPATIKDIEAWPQRTFGHVPDIPPSSPLNRCRWKTIYPQELLAPEIAN